MFGSAVLEVGVGMALLFLFMSIIATALREIVENVMKSRAKDLERGLWELLQDRKTLVAAFYKHLFITSLYEGDYVTQSRGLPSYIPRQNFSLAVLDLVAKTGDPNSPLTLASLQASLPAPDKRNALQAAVGTAIEAAGNDLAAVRRTIEDWYDGTMDRVSGWYTRRSGRILFGIGLGAAIIFNVDALTVGRELRHSHTLGPAVVTEAEQRLAAAPPIKGSSADADGTAAQRRAISDLTATMERLDYPIGWTFKESKPFPTPQACRAVPGETNLACTLKISQAVEMALGWLITALAIMLGAPFWFDVLNKIMVVRSTIKPKEKSPDEPSPDRAAPPPAAVTNPSGTPPAAPVAPTR